MMQLQWLDSISKVGAEDWNALFPADSFVALDLSGMSFWSEIAGVGVKSQPLFFVPPRNTQ